MSQDELYCYRDGSRVCNASCMAYISPPEGSDYKDANWACCLLLVAAHKTGKHLTVLAQESVARSRQAKNEAADRARMEQPKPPRAQ